MTLFSKFTKANSSEKTIHPWSQRKLSGSSAALPRFGHGAAMIDNQHLLVFGGFHKGSIKKNLFLIDTNTMSASAIHASGDIPSPRGSTAIVSIDGLMLLFGGEPINSGEVWDPQLYILHTHSNQWSKIRISGNPPRGRSGHTMSAHNGSIYVWGGHHQGQYLNDLSKAEWQLIPYTNQAPSPRAGHISVAYDNKLYIFGGVDGSHLYNDIWYFDILTQTWNQVNAVGYIPTPRESCGATLVDDTIYIFGGRGINGVPLGDLYAFRIKNQRWFTFQNMGVPPSARYGASLTSNQSKIYVYGGECLHGKAEDGPYVHILDCSKIKYPPENSTLKNEEKDQLVTKLNPSKTMLNDVKDTQQTNAINKSNVTDLVQSTKLEYIKLSNPPRNLEEYSDRASSKTSIETQSDTHKLSHIKGREPMSGTPSPRPPRGGIPAGVSNRVSAPNSEEKGNLLKEILVRDTIISEMKKKEQWWRTEVSILRHTCSHSEEAFSNEDKIQDAMLFEFKKDKDENRLLLEQLVQTKAEVRKIKNSVSKQMDSLMHNLSKPESIRAAALEEAAYYKARYTAIKSRDRIALNLLEADRVGLLEHRLKEAYTQKESINTLLTQVQRRSQEDQTARLLAEERASVAQKQSEVAQEAHQAALEKTSKLYGQLLKTEAKCREDAIRIAHLSSSLVNQLSLKEDCLDLSEMHIKTVRLEATNIKYRNEVAALLKQLEECQDEQESLKSMLAEKEHAYAESLLELEKTRIELDLVRRSTTNRSTENGIEIATSSK
ncbi:hypothetical protein G6F33_006687 [Rhizopus arrhizus]|nr:hypothetical protein G6F33_006687 [Rhizopus arrhizus]